MTTDKPTAAEAYRERQSDIATLMQWISDELEQHAGQSHCGARKTWADVDELAYARGRLMETLGFLSNSETTEIEEALEDARA